MSQSAETAGPGASPPPAHVKAAKGQPRGLWVLFITEMWERFSFYGMRALLVYYLAAKTTAVNFGFGWEQTSAMKFYAWYTALVYLMPIFGGWLADKFLGTHRSMLIGGWIIALGELCLAATELWGRSGESVVLFDTAPGQFFTFMSGIVLIIVGTGFFKPCVSVMVGQLYDADDPRRDSGFTIFYMGINVGALLSGIVAGSLGEIIGWHWGCFSAGVGMIFGLIVYQIFRPFFLKGIGLPPHHRPEHTENRPPTPEEIEQARIDEYERTRPLTRVDWERLIVIVVLSTFAIGFWAVFEQAGSSLNFFALNRTDRAVWGLEFPATWYQSANPLFIVALAPLFAMLWGWLDRRGLQPSTPIKFGIGLAILGAASIAMILGSLEAGSPKPVELADTPQAVQSALEERRRAIEEYRRKEAAKNRSEDEAEEEQEEKPPFDVLEKLAYDNAEYYSVAFENELAIVYELYDAEGRLLKRGVECKAENGREEIHGAPPEATTLDRASDKVKKAILAETGGHPIQKIERVLVARDTLAVPEGATGNEKPPTRDVYVFKATWTGDVGEMSLDVRDDGLTLRKDSAEFHQVGLAGPEWLLIFYLLATCGELCLSPVGLSMVTKLSPARFTSLMMGFFFCTMCLGDLTAGYMAAYSEEIATGRFFTLLGGQADFFLIMCIVPLAISAVVLVLSPILKRMMHGL